MKKAIKIISFFILFIFIFSLVSLGFGIEDLDGSPSGENNDYYSVVNGQTLSFLYIKNIGNVIINVLSTIGIIVSVVVLIVLGIKYMMGSVEEKANYKATLLPYTIGAALVFAASTIAQIVYNVVISA